MSLRDDYVHTLEAENDALREHIAQLEEQLGLRVDVPIVLNLTGSQRKLFGLLLKREFVTKPAAMSLLYRDADKDAEPKIIDVMIHHIRRKLKPFGIAIETKWGQGCWIDAESKARLRALQGGAS